MRVSILIAEHLWVVEHLLRNCVGRVMDKTTNSPASTGGGWA